MSYRIGIDAGGTFTDFVAIGADGLLTVYKTPSNPDDPVVALLNGLSGLANNLGMQTEDFIKQIDVLLHGSTVALNTLIQRRGAKTALLVTAGHEDSLELRLGHKEDGHRWDFHYPPADIIVPAHRRLGVKERILSDGRVHETLNLEQLDRQLDVLKELEIEAIAISCLWSFANPVHENCITETVKKKFPACFISSSLDILPRVGEYMRTSTTAANAYIGPAMDRYLSTIESALFDNGFTGQLYIMQSNGGVVSPKVLRTRPVAALNSGPAGGPVAALWYGEMVEQKNVISIDMGGTSFDICLARDGLPDLVDKADIARVRIGLPMVNVISIGAGGGSIARLDERNLLRVGPQSAEANPGPACYGRGGSLPTVTDALVVAGYLPDTGLLGGDMPIDKSLAEEVVQLHIAEPAGLSLLEASSGIIKITTQNMVEGIRIASIERGHDPRDYLLVAGGGAGPAFAAALARELGIDRVLIPCVAGTLCALGEATADLRYDSIRACPSTLTKLDIDAVNTLLEEMEQEGRNALDADNTDSAIVRIEQYAEMKYVDQIHNCDVRMPDGEMTKEKREQLRQHFHQRHKELFTYCEEDNEPELVSIRLSVIIKNQTGEANSQSKAEMERSKAISRDTLLHGNGELTATPIYMSNAIEPGQTIQGPAIIQEFTTTVVIPVGDSITFYAEGYYLLKVDTIKH
ncbi:MAG: hydantoinase/oxoprolinase family protein [Pseudomonadales bacterium]|nr:hydantoinase/oxoprolinase family protein [Pseudomonadales bacterium]